MVAPSLARRLQRKWVRRDASAWTKLVQGVKPQEQMELSSSAVISQPAPRWMGIFADPNEPAGFLFFRLSILTMLIQAVVVSTAIKGLVPAFLLVLLQFGFDTTGQFLGRSARSPFRPLIYFLVIFAAWQGISQLANAFWTPNLHNAQLVSPEDAYSVLLRKSLFTQTLYLITSVLFFLYLRNHLIEHDSRDRLLKLARIGVLIFVAYGFYEVIGYAVTGHNVDFLSNRVTGNQGGSYSNFQRLALGGIELVRMKSLASEASMFTFSLLPFMILYLYLKDKAWIPLLIAIVVSTSTTAYLGLATFFVAEMMLFGRWKRFAIAVSLVAVAWLYLQTTALGDMIGFILDKAMGENTSGATRSALFANSMDIFANGSFVQQLFGHGFGYIRSTDGFATLLVNVGVLGMLAYVAFSLYPFFKMPWNTEYRKALLLGTITTIVTGFVSVSEFYFFHTWFFTALAWHELYIEKKSKGAVLVNPTAGFSPQLNEEGSSA